MDNLQLDAIRQICDEIETANRASKRENSTEEVRAWYKAKKEDMTATLKRYVKEA